MSNSNIKDDKQMGNNDKDQRDKDQLERDQKANADRQRQQSTGQPGSGQQGGQNDNRNTQQGSGGSDPNRKGGKM
jgi:hypothetical protein